MTTIAQHNSAEGLHLLNMKRRQTGDQEQLLVSQRLSQPIGQQLQI